MSLDKFKQTEIGRIPKEWEVVRLEKVIKEIRNGFASGKRDDDGVVQIRMNNVTTDGHLIFDSFLKVPIPGNINDFLLKENDFLFNNTNSIDLVGKSTIFKKAPFPCTFSNHFTRIRFTEKVLPEWILFHFIKLWRKGFFKSVAIRHVGQSAVQTKFITNIQLPLPPLPEQQKIAEILMTADEAIQKVDEAITKMGRLKKGLMQELLTKGWRRKDEGGRELKETEIGRIPKEWDKRFQISDLKIVKINEICDVETGTTPNTKISDYWENGSIKWITPTDLSKLNGRIIIKDTERKITKQGLIKSSLKVVPKGSIIISSRAPIGYISVLDDHMTFNQGCKGLVIKDCQKVDSFYLAYQLLTQVDRMQSLGTGSTFKEITKSAIGNLSIPLPPLPEQKKIAEILSTVDNKLELLREKKQRFERIKKGLMNDLLTGKRRVWRMENEG